jgi:hypothetical protein
MGLPTKEAERIETTVPHEWEVSWRFENYKAHGGVLPEENFNRCLELLDDVLSVKKRDDLRFIPGQDSDDRERRETCLGSIFGEFNKTVQGQALIWALQAGYRTKSYGVESGTEENKHQLPKKVELMYCILTENTGNVLRGSEEGAGGDEPGNESVKPVSPEVLRKLQRDRPRFAEALLINGEIEAHQTFINFHSDKVEGREDKRNQTEVAGEGFVEYEPLPRPPYPVEMPF